jgi:pimeloyl-ACP methyl ester carboxylesterase
VPYADHDGIRIHYHVEGSGPPLFLHHGFTIDLRTWYQWGYVDALKSDYRLIMIDSRGHGSSDKPHNPAAYELSLRARDVLAVLDDLGLQQAHFLGYSLGGRIGFHTAALAPERLSSMIIGGATAFEIPSQPSQRFNAGLEAFFDSQPLPNEIKTSEFRAQMLANDVQAFIAAEVDRPSLEHILPTLPMPCLLYGGDADPGYESFARCAGQIPGATFVTLHGVDHWAGKPRQSLGYKYVPLRWQDDVAGGPYGGSSSNMALPEPSGGR